MPEEVFQAWSILSPSNTLTTDLQYLRPYHLVIADRLRTLRTALARQPLSQIPRIVDWGRAVSEQEDVRISVLKRTQTSKAGRKTRNINATAKGEHTAQLAAAQDKLKALMAADQSPEDQGNPVLLASSPLSRVRIGDTTSSKLNYILNEVRCYVPGARPAPNFTDDYDRSGNIKPSFSYSRVRR